MRLNFIKLLSFTFFIYYVALEEISFPEVEFNIDKKTRRDKQVSVKL